jgi:hypothetical protein
MKKKTEESTKITISFTGYEKVMIYDLLELDKIGDSDLIWLGETVINKLK